MSGRFYLSDDEIHIGPTVNEKDVQFAINTLYELGDALKSATPQLQKYVFQMFKPLHIRWFKEAAAKWALYREKFGPNEIDPDSIAWIEAALAGIKKSGRDYAGKVVMGEIDKETEKEYPLLERELDELLGSVTESLFYACKLARALYEGRAVVEPFDYSKFDQLYLREPQKAWLKN